MCCQTLERTLIDKLFAVCDYYLLNKSKRNSRHLYDIYKLSKHVDVNKINELIPFVRKHRLTLGEKIAPAANEKYAIINLYNEIFNTYFYRDDYNSITKKLILDEITYEEIEERIRKYIYLLKI